MAAQFISRLASVWRSYRNNRNGASAAEFALVLSLLAVPLLNVFDIGVYIYDRMQLNNAAQAGAQVAWTRCASDATKLPATVNCTGLSSAVTTAAQSTSLGTNVTVSSITENYYCLNGSGALVTVGTFPTTQPADCSGVSGGSASDHPADYVLVTASYTYAPFYSAVSVASLLTTPITLTAWMRMS